MNDYIDDILISHLNFEGEQVHLLTSLYGILVGDEAYEDNLLIAKSFELMKASTLILDDFLDKSPLRNGIPSLYLKLGSEEAVLVAEILKSSSTITFSQALKRIKISNTDLVKSIIVYEDAYRAICLGQLEEIRSLKKYFEIGKIITENEYLSIIEKTTANFIQLPLVIGSIVRKENTKNADLLREYGLNIGLAYQIRDDILDLVGDVKITGKPRGGDIKEKKMRLPIIHFLMCCNSNDIEEFKRIYSKDDIDQVDINVVVGLLLKTNSFNYCLDKLNFFCEKARSCISGFHNANIRNQLTDIVDILPVKSEEINDQIMN